MFGGLVRRFREVFLAQISENQQYSDHARWLLFVLFYAILANLPFWAASHRLGLLPLGWISIEYAAVGLIALFAPRILAVPLLVLAIAADIVSGVSKTYFLAPTECLANMGSVHEFPATTIAAIFAVALLALLIVLIAALFPVGRIQGTHRLCAVSCLVACGLGAISMDCIWTVRETGKIPAPLQFVRQSDARQFSYFTHVWVARYPAIRLVREQILLRSSYGPSDTSLADAPSIQSAAEVAVRAAVADTLSPHQRPNLVMVLVESWGINNDPAFRNSLMHTYLQPDLLSQYQVLQGTVPFYGPTVAAEARELCNSKIGGQIINILGADLKSCLPDRLRSLGYHTIALHGMDGHMFRRMTWYDSIGFQDRWFRDRFRQQGLPDCVGAFTGTCDADVAKWIGNRLQKKDDSPDFVYWVTLNSHLPVPIPPTLPAPDSCSSIPLLAAQPALCSWYQLVANVHHSIAQLAVTKPARPTVFVIVGDHAPPFADPALRSQFSSTDVPYIVLVPRPVGTPSQLTIAAGN